MTLKLTIGRKLFIGFGIILLITLFSGIQTIKRMKHVGNETIVMNDEFVPEVEYAQTTQNGVNQLLYDIQGYWYGENETQYDRGQNQIKELRTTFKQTDELIQKSTRLGDLTALVAECRSSLDDYAKLVDEMQKGITQIKGIRQELMGVANQSVVVFETFLKLQNSGFENDVNRHPELIDVAQEVMSMAAQAQQLVSEGIADRTTAPMDKAIKLLSTDLKMKEAFIRSYYEFQLPLPWLDEIVTRGADAAAVIEKIKAVIPTDPETASRNATHSGQLYSRVKPVAINDETSPEPQSDEVKSAETDLPQDAPPPVNKKAAKSRAMDKELETYVAALEDANALIKKKNKEIRAKNRAMEDSSRELAQQTEELAAAQQSLETAKQSLTDAKTALASAEKEKSILSQRIDSLEKELSTIQEESSAKIAALEHQNNAAQSLDADVEPLKKEFDIALRKFNSSAKKYYKEQLAEVNQNMMNHRNRLTWAYQIMDLLSKCQIATFNAQASHNMQLIQDALPMFTKIDTLFASLIEAAPDKDAANLVRTVKDATDKYKKYMQEYVGVFEHLQTVGSQQRDAADKLLNVANKEALAGRDGIRGIADKVQTNLRATTGQSILWITLATLIGMAGAFVITKNITVPIRRVTKAAAELARGNVNQTLNIKSNDEIGQLAEVFSKLISTQKSIISEFEQLAQAGDAGDLSYRCQPEAFEGAFREVVDIANQTLDNIARPIGEALSILKQLSVHDTGKKMDEHYRGDYLTFAQSINAVRGSMDNLVGVLDHLAAGDLSDLPRFKDIGRLSPADKLIPSLIATMESINLMAQDTQSLVNAALQGDLTAKADASVHNGVYHVIVEGINKTLAAVIAPLTMAAENVERISHGDIPELIQTEYAGSYNIIKNNINLCITRIKQLVEDTTMLANAGIEGKLDLRADASRHAGDFRKIVDGINRTLDAIITPLSEAASVLQSAAGNDLTLRVAGEYKGQLAELKNDVNKTMDSLHQALIEVRASVSQVNGGAIQISSASQSLSENATNQAASLQQITSSVSDLGTRISGNARNAGQASQFTESVRDAAAKGSEQMKQMLDAMKEINDSSKQIAKIMKVIDDIAFQTNLLALNAAVEAARAGVHGKGFAVVADEVRNLAGRSADAAKETARLIEASTAKVAYGLKVAQSTEESFVNIVEGVVKTNELISEIAVASNEQAQGVSQVNIGLQQVDQVTQQNTANSEQMAAAASELNSQSDHLNNMLSLFTLLDVTALPPSERANRRRISGAARPGSTQPKQAPRPPQAPGKQIRKTAKDTRGWSDYTPKNNGAAREQMINLDDDEFGRYS